MGRRRGDREGERAELASFWGQCNAKPAGHNPAGEPGTKQGRRRGGSPPPEVRPRGGAACTSTRGFGGDAHASRALRRSPSRAQVAQKLGLRTEDLVEALKSSQESAPTSSAFFEPGSSVRYQVEAGDKGSPPLEGNFEAPEASEGVAERGGPGEEGTMAVAFKPEEAGDVRFTPQGRASVKGQRGFALPVRRTTSKDSLRASLDEQRLPIDETPEAFLEGEGEELAQPLLTDRALSPPAQANVEGQTASLAPGADAGARGRLPVLNIPHQHGEHERDRRSEEAHGEPTTPKGYLVGYPSGEEEEGKGKDYLFAVPKPGSEKGFWGHPLPSGVSDVNLDIGPQTGQWGDEPLQLNITVTRKTPLIGWALLVVSCVSVAMTGFGMKMQKGPSSMMKCTWRSMATALVMLPFCCFFVLKERLHQRAFMRHEMVNAALASIGFLIFNGSFMWALDHTSVSHCFLLNNLHSVLIVAFRALVGNPVQLLEALGALVGIGGAVLISVDGQLQLESKGHGATSLLGDLVAALGSVFGAVYFVCAKETRPTLNISIFAVICHAINLPLCIAFTYLDASLYPQSPWPTWDRDPSSGMFGWMTAQQLPSEAIISLVSTIMGTTGYVLVMRYVQPLAISVVTLLEPVIATAIGIAAGIDTFPGGLTIFGAITLLVGTIMVLRCERGSEIRTNISEHAKKV